MATPHSQPLLITDPELDLFYYYVANNWTELLSNEENHQEITLVSVGGGARDFFIPEKLTKWLYNSIHTSVSWNIVIIVGIKIFYRHGVFCTYIIHIECIFRSIKSPAVPAVWSSTDHLCIVWCKQLVMSVVRSLFDLVEYKNKQKYFAITSNVTTRQAVLNYHFKKVSLI